MSHEDKQSADGRHAVDQFYRAVADPTEKLSIATYEGDIDQALNAIEAGANINAVHPKSGMPLVHLAAGGGHKTLVDRMLGTGECDLTVRDPMGRLASDCAAYSARKYDLAEVLAQEEGRQFRATGKDPRRDHRPA